VAGEQAWFVPAGAPNRRLAARLLNEAPRPWDRSTSLIRLQLTERDARAAPLVAGTVGRVEFSRKPRDLLVVPSAAVLQSGEGPYVLTASTGGGFRRRPIEIGKTFGGWTAVVSGVRANDLVVCQNAFFADADRRMQEAQP
jgi:Cu(I)/Ag(I) efflux system membrane fusion protein